MKRAMRVDPLTFEFKLEEFDLSLLPADSERLKADEKMMRSRVKEYLREVFGVLRGEWRITHRENCISVTWLPQTSRNMDSVMDQLLMGLLQRRAFGLAETVLRTLLSKCPDDCRGLFNLGILLCEQGRLREARDVLGTLTRQTPNLADGWNALGVVFSREGKRTKALGAFQRSLSLAPNNGSTLRNLGTLMAMKDPKSALPFLHRAATLLPSDQSAQYTYGKALMDIGNLSDADRVLKKAIALGERSGIADLCRESRIRIARKKLKGAVPRGLRTDVVVFCQRALETFKVLGRESAKAVLFELASLGSGGLDINDRASRFRLSSLPGEFTALQLVVLMYVALKKTAPRTDAGIDFSKEYAFAIAMLAGKKGTPCRGNQEVGAQPKRGPSRRRKSHEQTKDAQRTGA